jgi:hypothetical protein
VKTPWWAQLGQPGFALVADIEQRFMAELLRDVNSGGAASSENVKNASDCSRI